MAVQARASKPGKIVWTLAAILCACTLTALWVTGARIKALKMAARRGETIGPIGGDPAGGRLIVRRNERRRIEHFALQLNSTGDLEVLDASGRLLVEFPKLQKGQQRGWQELQMVCVEESSDAITLEVQIKPGSACSGGGRYRALRQGLQIEFSRNRALTVTAWEPQTPEISLKFQTPKVDLERKIPLEGNGEVFGMTYRLDRDRDGGHVLLLDTID
jgi:hypothetical protein